KGHANRGAGDRPSCEVPRRRRPRDRHAAATAAAAGRPDGAARAADGSAQRSCCRRGACACAPKAGSGGMNGQVGKTTLMPEGVAVTTLPNGLIVASDFMPGIETVSVGVWVGVGTRHEPEPLNGVSHLLEHMAFKGTERRSAIDIAVE